jgi:aarF domain-containing kinase
VACHTLWYNSSVPYVFYHSSLLVPAGLQRSAQALKAILTLVQDYARTGQVDPPEVILRKLFERLGATYIKLGQFVASSPSLFPAEYVTEFQKCLDQTEPVPYETIRKIIEEELTVPIDQVRTPPSLP